MTKEEFYEFSKLMAKDSKTLYDNQAYHNSVYLAGYVLEGYIKILLIEGGATTHQGQNNNSYGGHINSSSFINRLSSTNPNLFNSSILNTSHTNYPRFLLNGETGIGADEWNINYRYEVNRWIDIPFSLNIQAELINIQQALVQLRIDGVLS